MEKCGGLEINSLLMIALIRPPVIAVMEPAEKFGQSLIQLKEEGVIRKIENKNFE